MTRRRYAVAWTQVGARDVERIAAYLIDEAGDRAPGIVSRIIARADSLTLLPGRGRVPPELRGFAETAWREVQEPPWRILYRIASGTVEIHGLLDGRRDLADILMDRLLQA